MFASLVFTATTLAAAAGSGATPPPSTERAAQRTIDIVVDGDAATRARVRSASVELVRRLDVGVMVLRSTDEMPERVPPALVIAYLDFRTPSAPTIDVEDGATRQELTRRTLVDTTSLETSVEAVMQILYSAVESQLQLLPRSEPMRPRPAPSREPQTVGAAVAVEPPARASASAKPEPRSGARVGFDIGGFFRLSSMGDSHTNPGVGLGAELRADVGDFQTGLMLLGSLQTSSELRSEIARAELRPFSLRLLPTLDAKLGRQARAVLGVGFGLDRFTLTSGTLPSGVRAPGSSAVDPLLATVLGLRFPLSKRAFVSVLGSLDFDLAPTTFVARGPSGPMTLLELPRLRAGLWLAASFTVVGAKRFPRDDDQDLE